MPKFHEHADLLTSRLNMTIVRDMHDGDFTREQVVSAIDRYTRGGEPHTPLEAAIKTILVAIEQSREESTQ